MGKRKESRIREWLKFLAVRGVVAEGFVGGVREYSLICKERNESDPRV